MLENIKVLIQIGLCGNLLGWLRSYIVHRSENAVFESTMFSSTSGIPQGSNLGPLLFKIYMNGIGKCLRYANFLFHAGDLKLFMQSDELDSFEKIQSDNASVQTIFSFEF